MKENKKALDEIYKGAFMGIIAMEYIINKIDDKEFKNTIQKELNNYKKITTMINDIYPTYASGNPDELSFMVKTMSYAEIEMKIMNDKSISKMADILIQGMNMGIIEGKKIVNNKKLDKKILSIINKFIDMQEKSVETLKQYL